MAHHKVLSWDVANFFTEMWFVSRRGRVTCLYGCFPYVFFILYEKFILTNKVTEGLPTAQMHSSALAVWPPAGRVSEGDRAYTRALWQQDWYWEWARAALLQSEWLERLIWPGESTTLRGWSPGTLVGMLPWKCVKDRGAHIPLHTYMIHELCSTAATNFRGDLRQGVAPCLKTNEKLEKIPINYKLADPTETISLFFL